MRSTFVATLLALLLSAASLVQAAESSPIVRNMGNVRGGDVKAAHTVIEKKCTSCHSAKLIDTALAANKDMLRIQQEMEIRGAKLSSKERDVLGIYWKQQNPLKQ